MTTVVFVHGTGGRSSNFHPSFAKIAQELQRRRADLNVVPCLWGDEFGARLHAHGASIPRYDTTRSIEAPEGETSGAEDIEQILWANLYLDPLYELRLLALRGSNARVDNGLQTNIVFGGLSPGDEVDERVQNFLLSPELQEKLDEMGIASVFSQARRAVVTSGTYHEVLQTVQDSQSEYRIALARAITAMSIVLCEQQQHAVYSLWDAHLRDEIVTLLIHELGGIDRSVPGSIATFLVANPLTLYLHHNRGRATDTVLPASGDILLYQARGEPIRQFIQQKIEQAAPPVVLLAHSLGGVACVDVLVLQEHLRRHVHLLITVGSQVPFLYEIGALQSLSPEQTLPNDFPAWLNLYDPDDFLSYIGKGVFPNQVEDEPIINHQPFPQAHDAYWKNPKTWETILSKLP